MKPSAAKTTLAFALALGTIIPCLCVEPDPSHFRYLAINRAALHPLRTKDGQAVDITPVLDFWQKFLDVYQFQKATPDRPLKEWRMVGGEVRQIVSDGVLVDPHPALFAPVRGQLILIRHLPNERKLLDGQFVADAAFQIDRYEYVNTAGAKMTIAAFDCGAEPNPAERAAWDVRRANELAKARQREIEEQQHEGERLAAAELAAVDTKAKLQRAFLYQLSQASNGLPEFQYQVGLRYLRGTGVPVNRAEARRWLKAAADQGFPMAIGKLRSLPEPNP